DIGNGKTYVAAVVGYDASADVAVIQLQNASGLTTASIGNSSSLSVGEAVLALGNAGGYGGTPKTAAGAVTALNQSITATDAYSDANAEHLSGLVETDDPIEPGDSGGPLVNSSGQVLGIDTAGNGGNGLESTATQAYAIPIDTALNVAQEIEAGDGSDSVHIGNGAILGVEYTQTSGTSIAVVEPGSPAAEAGIVAGDQIVAIGGTSVSSLTSISAAMYPYHPGDRVTVTYQTASGETHSATVTLIQGPPQ
ncbi:MAG TPA: trypsin-like peptidase domain-containing protein, partial [Acidimicrobiales bacterium]|nr:trypsin-like peptidase domain-containing protein [Acidimicrobiales bacterium]